MLFFMASPQGLTLAQLMQAPASQPLTFRPIEWLSEKGRMSPRPWLRRNLLGGAFAVSPIALLAFPPYHWSVRLIWLASLGLLAWCSTAATWVAWDGFTAVSPGVDKLMAATPDRELEPVRRWVRLGTSVGGQIIGILAGTTPILLAVLFVRGGLVFVNAFSMAEVVLVAATSAECLYLVIVTAEFCRRYSKVTQIDAVWVAPFHTPELLALSDAIALQAWLASLLIVGASLPLTFLLVKEASRSVELLFLLCLAIPIVSVAAIGLVAQNWISQPTYRAKIGNLAEVSALIHAPASHTDSESMHMTVELYSAISATPDSLLRRDLVTQYAAAALAAGVPALIAFLAHRF